MVFKAINDDIYLTPGSCRSCSSSPGSSWPPWPLGPPPPPVQGLGPQCSTGSGLAPEDKGSSWPWWPASPASPSSSWWWRGLSRMMITSSLTASRCHWCEWWMMSDNSGRSGGEHCCHRHAIMRTRAQWQKSPDNKIYQCVTRQQWCGGSPLKVLLLLGVWSMETAPRLIWLLGVTMHSGRVHGCCHSVSPPERLWQLWLPWTGAQCATGHAPLTPASVTRTSDITCACHVMSRYQSF